MESSPEAAARKLLAETRRIAAALEVKHAPKDPSSVPETHRRDERSIKQGPARDPNEEKRRRLQEQELASLLAELRAKETTVHRLEEKLRKDAWRENPDTIQEKVDDAYAAFGDRLAAVEMQLAAAQRENVAYRARFESLAQGGSVRASSASQMDTQVSAVYDEIDKITKENVELSTDNITLEKINERLRVLLSLSQSDMFSGAVQQ